jgi:hypothetical protein
MLEFIRTRSYRRKINSRFLDSTEHSYISDKRGLARYNNYGDGWTTLERRQRQTSEAKARVEHILSELVEDYPVY